MPKPRIGKPLTDEDIALAKSLRANGMPYRRIAERIGCSEVAVHRWLKRGGVRPEQPPSPWSIRDPILLSMFKEGKKDSEIAQVLGISTNSVNGRRNRLGLLRRPAMKHQPPRAPSKGVVPFAEPSLAMRRLAEFDPVIARALRVRLGLPIE